MPELGCYTASAGSTASPNYAPITNVPANNNERVDGQVERRTGDSVP
jgi:hypothetical protein